MNAPIDFGGKSRRNMQNACQTRLEEVCDQENLLAPGRKRRPHIKILGSRPHAPYKQRPDHQEPG